MNNNTIKGPNVHCVNNTLREYVSTSAIAYLLIESHGPCIVWQPFVRSDFGLFFVVVSDQHHFFPSIFFYFFFNSRMFNNLYIDFCVCIIAIAGCLLIQYSLTTTCLEIYTPKKRHLYSVQRQCFFYDSSNFCPQIPMVYWPCFFFIEMNNIYFSCNCIEKLRTSNPQEIPIGL